MTKNHTEGDIQMKQKITACLVSGLLLAYKVFAPVFEIATFYDAVTCEILEQICCRTP